MRQGNGSDLLGANDPRSATIGVIYVAPNDDRESVLAAILTQEKLGRKQIAIVLPTQNKAFQRPVDFDGLKNMRRKLQAQFVIVAPHGSSPAEFARQRHFTLYTSLENYGESLREENEASRASRRGRWSLFGARQPKAQATGEDVTNDSEQIPTSPLPAASQNHIEPSSNNVDEQGHEQHAGSAVDAAALGLGLGAGAVAADHFMQTPADNSISQPPLTQHPDASDDDLALATPAPPDSPAANGIPARDEIKPLPANQKPVEDSTPIITFPSPSRPRNLNNQSVSPDTAELEEKPAPVQPVPVVVPLSAPNGRRDSGKMAAVGAGSAAGGAVPATGIPGSGGGPPGRGNGGNGGGQPSGQPRRSGLRWLLLALVALLLLSLLLCGGLALAAPSIVPAPLKNIFSGVTGGGTPSATVTITPKSADLHNTYVITGVTTGTPGSSKRQVQARMLTPVMETQAKTVAATGVLNIPATQATGTLTFYNGNGIDEVVKASSFVLAVNGVQIKLTADVDIPPANAGTLGVKNAAAFADPPGASGNIPAGTISQFCCGNSAISVKNNTAFSGGKNATTETIVQQSDINNAATPLENSLKQAALTSSNFKKQPGEQFLPNQPQCNTFVSSNPAAGQRSQSVTVTVKVTCTGEVYDQNGAQALAANLLKSEATKATGPGYALVGNIVTTITQASAGGTGGTVTLFVKAEGVWVYQFTGAQKAQLAQLIAGKTQNDANALLSQQAGVAKVNGITLTSGTKLPTDPKQITIVVESVPGLQGTPTGGPGAGTPTFTTSPVPRPSPSVVPGK